MSNRRIGKKRSRYAIVISGVAVFILFVGALISYVWQKQTAANTQQTAATAMSHLSIEKDLLTPNEYSRPQIKLKKVKGVVVHYTANPGTDAIDNRNYFNNLKESNKQRKKSIYASSHFIIGLEGQIIQCIPLDEISYASNDRNKDTISIECCHKDKTGEFNQATYQSLVELVAYLCITYGLEEKDIIRHYDVTGKKCPLYYVEYPDKWNEFKKDVTEYMKKTENP